MQEAKRKDRQSNKQNNQSKTNFKHQHKYLKIQKFKSWFSHFQLHRIHDTTLMVSVLIIFVQAARLRTAESETNSPNQYAPLDYLDPKVIQYQVQ